MVSFTPLEYIHMVKHIHARHFSYLTHAFFQHKLIHFLRRACSHASFAIWAYQQAFSAIVINMWLSICLLYNMSVWYPWLILFIFHIFFVHVWFILDHYNAFIRWNTYMPSIFQTWYMLFFNIYFSCIFFVWACQQAFLAIWACQQAFSAIGLCHRHFL